MISSDFRQPTYLADAHKPKHRIRCPIHGFIRFSDAEREIIDHPVFRRLRYIRQLAMTETLYPSATHTRFEHSLGVMETATRMFDRLAADKGELLERVFSEVEQLKDDTLAKARQIVRLAALLHDTGHSCFSHAAEKVFHKGSDHESLTVRIITDDKLDWKEELPSWNWASNSVGVFKQLLNTRFFPQCAELTANLIKSSPDFPLPQLGLLQDIVSGQVDADRTDYLLRDSYHCGVEYGRFDHLRLIECLTVYEDKDSGETEMGIYRDGIHSFESLILARYQMNNQVYYHRLRLIYDLYLEKYFRSLDEELFNSDAKILGWNDVRAMNQILLDSMDTGSKGHEWARRIVHRDHHRDIYAVDDAAGELAIRTATRVLRKIKEENSDIDFVADIRDEPVTIHKILRNSDSDGKGIDFPLIDRGSGVRESLGEKSQILVSLSKSYRIGMIFAATNDRELRKTLSSRCREFARS